MFTDRTLQYGVPAVLCVTMAVRCAKLAIYVKICYAADAFFKAQSAVKLFGGL